MRSDSGSPVVGAVATWALASLIGAAAGGPLVARSRSLRSAFLVSLVGVTLAWWSARHRGARVRAAVACLAVVATAAGIAAVRLRLLDSGSLAQLARSGGDRAIAATVVSDPRPTTDGRWWSIVRVERLGSTRTRERALLIVGDDRGVTVGSRWTGVASARPLDHGGFGRYLRHQHTAVEIQPSVLQPAGGPGWLAAATDTVRRRVRLAAARALPPAEAGLAAGLVTGDTSAMPRADADAMRDAGLTHLVAVSGANVALVVLGTQAVLTLVTTPARARRRLVLGVLAWFVFLTRWEPSVLRAGTTAGIVLLAGARGRLVDARHALGVAVLVLVLADPGIAGSLGLLLSAAATGGVLMLAPLVQRRLRFLPRRAAVVLAATLGAQLAVAPLLLVEAGQVPLASIPANLVAVPAAAVGSVVVSAGAVIAAVHPAAAVPVFVLARPALVVVLAAARGLRSWGEVLTWQRPATILAAAAATGWLLSGDRRHRRVALVTALLATAWLTAPRLGLPPVRGLVVTAIDVGQGDAILVEAPGGRLLVDGGPDDRAARWLRASGVRSIGLVVLSHPHADHGDGLPAILRQSRVGAVWSVDVPSELASVPRTLEAAAAGRVTVAHPTVGQAAAVGSLHVEILGPPAGRPYRWVESEPNDSSLVLRVRYAGRVALLTGDIERAAQTDLLRSGRDLRSGVLKVPHHGGATSDPAFLRAAAAPVAVVSVGERNRYGHPRAEVLDALAATGAAVRRTDRDGTVRVAVAPTEPEVVAAGAEAQRWSAHRPTSGPRPLAAPSRITSLHGPSTRRPARGRRRSPPPARPRATARGPPGGAP